MYTTTSIIQSNLLIFYINKYDGTLNNTDVFITHQDYGVNATEIKVDKKSVVFL